MVAMVEEGPFPSILEGVERQLSGKSKRGSRARQHGVGSRPSSGSPFRGATTTDEPKKREKKFLPLPFLAITASFFVQILFPYQWELVWTSDQSPRWIQPATLLVAIVSLWSLVEAVMASQLRTMAIGSAGEESEYTTRRLLEAVGRRGGFMALWLTALGAVACAESADPTLKPTSVLSDMATVGVLLGLALCVPLALSTAWHCFGEMRREGNTFKWIEALFAAGFVSIVMALAFLGALGKFVRSLH